jgi:hypothetical protein
MGKEKRRRGEVLVEKIKKRKQFCLKERRREKGREGN